MIPKVGHGQKRGQSEVGHLQLQYSYKKLSCILFSRMTHQNQTTTPFIGRLYSVLKLTNCWNAPRMAHFAWGDHATKTCVSPLNIIQVKNAILSSKVTNRRLSYSLATCRNNNWVMFDWTWQHIFKFGGLSWTARKKAAEPTPWSPLEISVHNSSVPNGLWPERNDGEETGCCK